MPILTTRHQRFLITLTSACLILIGTVIAIQFAKGYRPTPELTLKGTGLLSASSNPKGSLIYINDQLSDKVTDTTINLKPGMYKIEFRSDGYTSWQKNLLVQKELVTQTNAHLFRNVPSLNPLTFSGAVNLNPSPDGQYIAFAIASPSAQLKSGLYTLSLSDRLSFFAKGPKLIAENPAPTLDFKDASIIWSPDSQQLVANFTNRTYLIDPFQVNPLDRLQDHTAEVSLLMNRWEQEITERDKQLLLTLPKEMQSIVTKFSKNLYFSPDSQKLLYTASKDSLIPPNLIPPLPASNNQSESRKIKAGNIYVYDLKEDKNFLVYSKPAELSESTFTKIQLINDLSESNLFTATNSPSLLQDKKNFKKTLENFRAQYSIYPFVKYQWFPSSNHILLFQNNSIQIVDYDGTNLTNLYQGQFLNDFVLPWPNGDKLVILTNLTQNPSLPPNLYTINLK